MIGHCVMCCIYTHYDRTMCHVLLRCLSAPFCHYNDSTDMHVKCVLTPVTQHVWPILGWYDCCE